MKFIGIDFGWQSQPSGLCCLELLDGKLQLLDLDRQEAIADILAWIEQTVLPEESAIIAVDAPTLIPNATGSRLPDKLSHKYFGKYHAGCYPANQNLAFAERTINLGLELESRGFVHAPTIDPQKPGRYQIEVFPHPAIVNLFGLERILKYKKGKISDRRLELIKLYNYILNILPSLSPPLCSLRDGHFAQVKPAACGGFPRCADWRGKPAQASVLLCGSFPSEIPYTGTKLKDTEDKLDSLICAYVAAYWWFWGTEKNIVLGDLTTGYIVVPDKICK